MAKKNITPATFCPLPLPEGLILFFNFYTIIVFMLLMWFQGFILKRFVWMLFPALIMLAQIGIEVFVPDRYMADLHSETGPHEYLQALILCPAVFLALRLITIAPSVAIKLWGGLALCGSIYVLGEELSWGQHWFE